MALCLRFLLNFVLVFSAFYRCVLPEVESLYADVDPSVQLTRETIKQTLHGKSNAWIVQFYSSWCGHCQRFAPVWKQFATELTGWHDVINTAVINCADSKNIETCRSYHVKGLPTIKLFKAFSSESQTGTAIGISGVNDVGGLLKITLDHLEMHTSSETPAFWPDLHPILKLEHIESLWDEQNRNRAHHILVYEKPDSILGRELILDTRNVKAVRTVRVFDTENTRKLMQEKSVTSLPAVLLCSRSTKCRVLSPGSTERGDFLTALRGYHAPSYHKDLVSIAIKDNGSQYSSTTLETVLAGSTAAYMRDMENAIYYSLAVDSARQSNLTGRTLNALKAYSAVLEKYFPGRPLLLGFLRKLNKLLQEANKELNPQKLTEFLKNEWDLPTDIEWIGCSGSQPHYRGYPCGLWVTFHTLTVGAYKTNARGQDIDPKEVLFGIRSFVTSLFGCQECRENFEKMAVDIGTYVNSTEDAVLWLWQGHNKVNKRLAGDVSEDPQFPKVQFPTAEFCLRCMNSSFSNSWNKLEVFNFLLSFYGDGIHFDNINRQERITEPPKSGVWGITNIVVSLCVFVFTIYLCLYILVLH